MDGFVLINESKVICIFNKGNLNLSRSLGDLEYKQNIKLTPEEQIITAIPDIFIEKLISYD